MEIDAQYLPPRAKDLADLVGLPALLRLVEWRGGVTLRIPTACPGRDHELAKRLGLQATSQLVDVYGGEEIEIPRCLSAVKAVTNREMVQRRLSGETEEAVALAYGVTGRWVRMQMALHRTEWDQKQVDLFG